MALLRAMLAILILLSGCDEASDDPDAASPDAAAPDAGLLDASQGIDALDLASDATLVSPDAAASDAAAAPSDAAVDGPADLAPPWPGDASITPGAADPPVVHAPPSALAGVRVLLPGQDVLDVSVDQGGGIWAVTAPKVYYFPPGRTTPYVYDQSRGLARGLYQWTDTWFSPGTYPVSFASVAGATPGAAVIGNLGAIADWLKVDPATGAVLHLQNLEVTSAQQADPLYLPEHVIRVVAAVRVVVDLNGTWNGTAYLGGYHGIYALHGLVADCQCLAFQEHVHYVDDQVLSGSSVRGLAISPTGDLWAGDRDLLSHLPQRSRGAYTDLFDFDFDFGQSVFPGTRDQIVGVAVDDGDGVWVASEDSGLAHLPPPDRVPIRWSAAVGLPQNRLRGLALDAAGDLWLGTHSAGMARLHPATGVFSYYTVASGLPSDRIRAISFDNLSGGGKLYVGTTQGLAIFTP